MDCPIQTKEGVDLILDYCSDRLGEHAPEKVIEFERHLSGGCEECTRVVEAQRAVWRALDQFDAPPVSADFDERLWKRIDEAESRPWWKKVWDGPALGWSAMVSWKPAFVTASACAAVFAVMLATRPAAEAPTAPTTPVVEKAVVVDFEQVEKALDDIDMLNQLGVVATDEKDPA